MVKAMGETETVTLNDFYLDSKWFFSNMDVLRKKFLDEFVAIKEQDVLDHDKNIKILVERLNSKGENTAFLFIEFVRKKGEILIF